MEDLIICDIDGTISNYQHRKFILNGSPDDRQSRPQVDWDRFHAAALDDHPIREVIKILKWAQFGGRTKIFLITGRPDRYRSITSTWLTTHQVPYHRLLMRKQGDFRSDTVVKQEIFEKHCKNYNVLFALEDRDKVVDMWRELGVRCLQVAKGEY